MAIQNHSKRPAWVAQKMDKQVKRRVGIDRHNPQVKINGEAVMFADTPEMIRERWCKNYGGRSYHFSIMRFKFRTADGRLFTALRGQCHDANAGYCLGITGFYNVKPAEILVFAK